MGKLASKTILVVDDDDVMRQKIKRILKSTDYQVVEAGSGRKAKEMIRQGMLYDCVLMDQRLGDIDGTELIPVINAEGAPPCPIVMITGMGDETLAVEAMKRGAYDYISKDSLKADYLLNVIAAGVKWASVESELRASQKKLEFLSMYDSLTELPNRQLFLDRLEHALLISRRDKTFFAVLMMDLNKFKEVNDALGHTAGDELLVKVAQRMKAISRASDTYARLGGDEFSAILYNMRSMEDACKVASKLNAAIQEPFELQGEVVKVGISIGIALYTGQDVDVKSLLTQADNSMYEAKKGDLGYASYSRDDFKKKNPALMIASCLADGLKNNEFYMVYQPQVDLVTGECCGVEALARWANPVLGNITPDVFVKIAERSSIIADLTYATFEMAFQQAKEWEKSDLQIPISINLSAKMLGKKEIVTKTIELLNAYEVDPKMLTFEVTETALVMSPQEASVTVQQLSDLGISISIDDFGTGFTSFTHLRHFALNELKIDKLFIKDLKNDTKDSSIVNSFVSLANGFGIKLVAEGVEDAEKIDFLRAAGCTRAQGYWISKPIDGNQIPEWLAVWDAQREQATEQYSVSI